MKTTFIGLGLMGRRMAANLLENNVDLMVYNRSPGPIKALEAQGASSSTSCRRAVQGADVVITMLATPEAVQSVAFGENGFVAAMAAEAIWVDCSTVNPSFSERAGRIARRHGVRFVDAPVAGSTVQAENAELMFLAGGDPGDIAAIEGLLGMMGSKVLQVGDLGKGSALKMLVNALLAQSMLAFAEAVLLGEKLGLSRDFLLDLLPNAVVCAPFTKAKAEMIRADDFAVQFPLELMHKDLHLVALTAYENNQPLCSANTAKELFGLAKQHGLGRQDFAAIYKFMSGA
jgi:3-hydroxyisobutyrate dehydrogenase-like beta-hydroxyacid dehydrogenase